MNFDTAFSLVIGNEGGFTLDRADRGNWTSGVVGVGELKGTKYGISAAAYPRLDIQNLSLEKAKELYLLDYWNACGCDLAPESVRYPLFDMAVNSGVKAAIKAVQSSLAVKVDGVYGDQTRAALRIASVSPEIEGRMYRYVNGDRLDHITEMDDTRWSRFGRGIVKRIARILKA